MRGAAIAPPRKSKAARADTITFTLAYLAENALDVKRGSRRKDVGQPYDAHHQQIKQTLFITFGLGAVLWVVRIALEIVTTGMGYGIALDIWTAVPFPIGMFLASRL